MKERHQFSESAEMYLKTIAEISTSDELVPVTSLAEQLLISTVSASEMIHKLQEQGLVEHTPYKGVRLTEEGARRANAVLRRHRLWERFLADQLGLGWEKAYDFACELEHVTGDELANALSKFLGFPQTCPHGNPIPGPDGRVTVPKGRVLADMDPGESGEVLRIQSPTGELLNFLEQRSLRPGVKFHVEAVDPLDGPVTLNVGAERLVLGRQVAMRIVVVSL